MNLMKDLDYRIREESGEDQDVYELLTCIINLHLKGAIKMDDMPHCAKFLLLDWEHDNINEEMYDEHYDGERIEDSAAEDRFEAEKEDKI